MLKIEDPKEGVGPTALELPYLQSADARTRVVGKQKAAGVEKYVVPHRSESNVSFHKDG